jgi:EmrB/QacA subfamily drug resistance transporter
MSDSNANRWLILALVCTGSFMMVLDFSIITVALPDIEVALNFSQQILQWVVSAYALTFGGFLLLGGRAADLFGRRRMFIIGVTLFTVASLVAGLAVDRIMLLIARSFQGIGAAIVSPAALSILLVTFPEGNDRNKALTIWGAMAAGGIAVGVLLGGVLTSVLSWRWVLIVNVPIGLLTLAVTPLLLKPRYKRPAPPYIDWPGALAITIGLVFVVYSLERAGSAGWQSVQLIIASSIATASLLAALVIEARSPAPLLPLSIFRRRSIVAGMLIGALMNAALGAGVIILTLYMQKVLLYSPLQAGLSFLPVAVVAVASAPFAPKLAARFGTKYTLAGSISMVAVGLLALSRVPVEGRFLTDLLPGGIAIGLGIVITQVSISITATSGVSNSEEGLVSGLLTTSQQIGSALGLAILIAVAAIRTRAVSGGAVEVSAEALTAGYQAALLTGASFAALAIVISLVVVKRKKV